MNKTARFVHFPKNLLKSHCLQERLRDAVEDFAQRIIPLFEELELGRQKIQKLEEDQHTKSQYLTAQSRKVDALQREVSHLQKSKAELEQNVSESLDSAEAFRVKAEELQGNLADAWRKISSKEGELNRAIDSLNRFKASVLFCQTCCKNSNAHPKRIIRIY